MFNNVFCSKYYLILSFRMEPIESAMNMYENLVPNVIHPDSILNQVNITHQNLYAFFFS